MTRMVDGSKWETWRRRLAAFDGGDSSVAEFCRCAGVSVASFYQWRRKLQRRTAVSTHARRSESSSARRAGRPAFRSRGTVPPVSFVPVEVTGGSSIEVHLPNGARVLIPCHDRKAIRTVIATVASGRREDPSC